LSRGKVSVVDVSETVNTFLIDFVETTFHMNYKRRLSHFSAFVLVALAGSAGGANHASREVLPAV
jgi:hypothetical protein